MMIETMNEGDCLKLHGKIDADDNARHTVPVTP